MGPPQRRVRVVLVDSYTADGKSISQLAMALLIALNRIDLVRSLDLISSAGTRHGLPEFDFPKTKTLSSFGIASWPSILQIARRIAVGRYDLAVFNTFPTSFGRSTTSNVAGMFVPLIVSLITPTQVAVIYHNSTFTNDLQRLGYDRPWDTLRARVLRQVEKVMFRLTRTFVLLKIYMNRINSELGYDAVSHLDIRQMDALGAAYSAGFMRTAKIDRSVFHKTEVPMVLLHGAWGPQKDLGFALRTMRDLRKSGTGFHLVLSGSVNQHFPEYEAEFSSLIHEYQDVIDTYRGTVSDREICQLFLSADLALLTYNAPGGVSGVLETAAFFGTPVIAISFPEFEEESRGNTNVKLCDRLEFKNVVRSALSTPVEAHVPVNLEERLESAQLRVASFLSAALPSTPTDKK